MINIYSAIRKMNLRGGTHDKVTNGSCYTTVNDLANVAKSLPRMPSASRTRNALIEHV